MKKNIIFYFSDQQRADTVNEALTPNLMHLADEGVLFENNFTCQPVCGPARACLQTGVYATQNGCFVNGIALKEDTKTLAHHFKQAGYQTAYIGKWHLASDRFPGVGVHCESEAIPKERLGGYEYFRGADVLEFTSHGYDGYIFDENGNRTDFTGYRADCINDFALEFLDKKDEDKPFFLFVSQLEPHHQNDRHTYEGYKPTVEKFKAYPLPDDLTFLRGDYKKMYPDYLSAINRLDYNVGRLIEKLKEKGIYDDTVIVYTSDHGCHFKTRNAEYKRSCHENTVRTPLIIKGGAFSGGRKESRLTSLIDLPPTLLSLAGIKVPGEYMGLDLASDEIKERPCVYIQISESQLARCIRTDRYKYSVRAPFNGMAKAKSRIYFEDYLYDLDSDPNEKTNLIKEKSLSKVRKELREMLLSEMEKADEGKAIILPAIRARKK